ncbi:regulator of cell morphogenesis and NO signaling [Mobilisporobacter senegalensis]|uniref:Regulator of cell morphogenesis and NO signaling n=1 Tax=Mobilisporobacter senegalensis TaxID=1329262 RepID=A0A3N1XKL3_9FIRM|nr:iron-sulfur cluster repair di-iron protein [Mobilisporobacter senegalensis]ROR27216.1 regulator of cell morphogenesis and NO signaling [Mobilisporobacter senegalensis]
MINYLDNAKTIGGVVAELPQASEIFKEFDIDFCCGGHRLLKDVVKLQGIDEKAINEKLNQIYEERVSSYQNKSQEFSNMSHPVLSTYIEDKHHSYLRKVLPETLELLTTILRVHGVNHKELFDVYKLFGTLKTDLEQHLLKEETMLFPAFNKEEENKDSIQKVSIEIINEHEAAGEILSELRRVTKDYQIPEDACQTFQNAYRLLEEIEDDLHQHIHLENNVLLKNYDIR